jgi:hypothetical protein
MIEKLVDIAEAAIALGCQQLLCAVVCGVECVAK